MTALLEAAATLDVQALRRHASWLPAESIATVDSMRRTAFHLICKSLSFQHARRVIETLDDWPNPNRTVYMQDVVETLELQLSPVFTVLLRRAPLGTASAADIYGVTPLHMAAKGCQINLITALLKAGAAPLAIPVDA